MQWSLRGGHAHPVDSTGNLINPSDVLRVQGLAVPYLP